MYFLLENPGVRHSSFRKSICHIGAVHQSSKTGLTGMTDSMLFYILFGRLAQRESASFTRKRPLVRNQYRPPYLSITYIFTWTCDLFNCIIFVQFALSKRSPVKLLCLFKVLSSTSTAFTLCDGARCAYL